MSKESQHCLRGVDCKAVNCVHNCKGKCDAKNICINCHSAVTEGETCCHTFELR